MNRKLGLTVCCALVASSVALAGNTVRVWYTDNPDPNAYLISFNEVKICAAGTYKIDATSPPSTALGFVNKIWIDPNISPINGDVFVYVVRDPAYTVGNDPHQPGVTELKEVNLTHVAAGYVGNLVEVRCTSHLGALGSILATNVSNGLYVGGDVLHSVDITGEIQAPISITGRLKSPLSCVKLDDITVAGVGTSLYTPPHITIGSSYAHQMTLHQNIDTLAISGAIDPNAHIQITGANDLYHLTLPDETGVIYGTVSVGGKLRSASLEGIGETGTLSVGAQIGYGSNDEFHVTGDVAGILSANSVDTSFQIDGAVTGTGSVTVKQTFDTAGFPTAEIGGVDPKDIFQPAGDVGGVRPTPGANN